MKRTTKEAKEYVLEVLHGLFQPPFTSKDKVLLNQHLEEKDPELLRSIELLYQRGREFDEAMENLIEATKRFLNNSTSRKEIEEETKELREEDEPFIPLCDFIPMLDRILDREAFNIGMNVPDWMEVEKRIMEQMQLNKSTISTYLSQETFTELEVVTLIEQLTQIIAGKRIYKPLVKTTTKKGE